MVFAVALLLQALSLFLLRQQLFGTWLQRPFPLMVVAATIYHGASEILMLSPTIFEDSLSRSGITPLDAHLAALAISGGIFVATITYLVALGHKGRHAQPSAVGLNAALRVLDWRILLVVLIPLAAATYAGGGYASGQALDSRSQGTLQLLASQFFLVFFVLTTFAFIARHGARFTLPALGVQSLLMAAVGQRLEIIISAVTVIVLLSLIGIRPRARQLIAASLIGTFLVLTIGTVRATAGREVFYSDTGIAERISVVASALARDGIETSTGDSYIAQAAARLDANELSGYVMRGLESGQKPIGWGGVARSLEVVIPSALNPDKLANNGTDLSAKEEIREQFGRPSLDTLPGHFGLYLGFVGPWGLLVLLAGVGITFAFAERWLFRRLSAARLIWFALLLLGALFYEKGFPSMLALLRYGIPLGLLGWLAQRFLPKLSAGRSRPKPRQVAVRA